MVVNAAQAEAVLFGREGVAAAAAPGTVVTVMSTLGPEPVRGFADRLAETGVRLVDAPVSGGVARARTGELLIMVGAPADDKAAVGDMFHTTDHMRAEKLTQGPI